MESISIRTRGCLVHQVDGFIRQKTVADITVREGSAGDQCVIRNSHTVMNLKFLLETPENGNRIFHSRLIHQNLLETPLSSALSFSMF